MFIANIWSTVICFYLLLLPHICIKVSTFKCHFCFRNNPLYIGRAHYIFLFSRSGGRFVFQMQRAIQWIEFIGIFGWLIHSNLLHFDIIFHLIIFKQRHLLWLWLWWSTLNISLPISLIISVRLTFDLIGFGNRWARCIEKVIVKLIWWRCQECWSYLEGLFGCWSGALRLRFKSCIINFLYSFFDHWLFL